ncbi:MAG TPA: aspartyl-phosphate phosphatase Spo0E family protein [Thermoanaerobacterales bacterium]|jgi:hypothetical protein|nr:aspartyl-phosphate phosphatase Spo0E family protein [Thermoanaerobacterales bacterium]
MNIKEKIETARNTLYYAIKKNYNKEKILKISREVDKHIIEYYRICHGLKTGICNIDDNLISGEETMF